MDTFTIYLRTALFSAGGPESHVPPNVHIIEGQIIDRLAGAIVVETARFRDGRGKELAEVSLTLQLPFSKIDHIVHHS